MINTLSKKTISFVMGNFIALMYVLICFILATIVCSCEKPAIKTERTSDGNFIVEYLFEYEGVKIYRFHDGGRAHYFTSRCESIYTQCVGIGKVNYYYDENIK